MYVVGRGEKSVRYVTPESEKNAEDNKLDGKKEKEKKSRGVWEVRHALKKNPGCYHTHPLGGEQSRTACQNPEAHNNTYTRYRGFICTSNFFFFFFFDGGRHVFVGCLSEALFITDQYTQAVVTGTNITVSISLVGTYNVT